MFSFHGAPFPSSVASERERERERSTFDPFSPFFSSPNVIKESRTFGWRTERFFIHLTWKNKAVFYLLYFWTKLKMRTTFLCSINQLSDQSANFDLFWLIKKEILTYQFDLSTNFANFSLFKVKFCHFLARKQRANNKLHRNLSKLVRIGNKIYKFDQK